MRRRRVGEPTKWITVAGGTLHVREGEVLAIVSQSVGAATVILSTGGGINVTCSAAQLLEEVQAEELALELEREDESEDDLPRRIPRPLGKVVSIAPRVVEGDDLMPMIDVRHSFEAPFVVRRILLSALSSDVTGNPVIESLRIQGVSTEFEIDSSGASQLSIIPRDPVPATHLALRVSAPRGSTIMGVIFGSSPL